MVLVADPAPAPRFVLDAGPALQSAQAAVDAALTHAGGRVIGWWQPLEDPLDYRAILNTNRSFSGSLSLGTTRDGTLREAAELPFEGKHHSIIERHRARQTRYGTQQMIDLIKYGAARVDERFPGSVLRVGNIGRKGGGRIPWSGSHHAGRDADIAFYCISTKDGQPVLAPDLLHFDNEGRAIGRTDLRFDVVRNWELAKALITHEEIGVQWLFISEGLKHMLLDHARQQGEEDALIERASQVLHQPTDALPHNDHFHLRIPCSRRDRIEGCLDGGPRWSWVDWHDEALLARSVELMRAFDDPRPTQRMEALNFLEKIRSPYTPEVALVRGVRDPDAQVRQRALELASAIPSWSATALVAAQQFIVATDTTDAERRVAYAILRRSGDVLAMEFALARLESSEVLLGEKVLAARTLGHIMRPELVPILIEHLAHQPASVREELARVLHRITNHSQPVNWTSTSAQAIAEGIALWQRWWDTNGHQPRETWLLNSYTGYGVVLPEDSRLVVVDHLIALLRKGPEHVVYNTNRMLQNITRRWAPLEETNGENLHRYWSGWWDKNRGRMLSRATNDND
ncbi:MAG: penicillin-insensitive murein endopeptidase [Bradymonadaceae bacterium]|nr:penicillin-insensitive murein endopeptidase [Lujinxingiaceae bacterium]